MSAPTSVLSDALGGHVRKQRVVAGVFTTFAFDPKFFEEEVVPILFDQTLPTGSDARLVMLEDALRNTRLAVYYDRQALLHHGSAKLDIRRIPVTRATGCFHPKLVLLLLEAEDQTRSLLVATLSANLTRSGWWENVEAAHVEVVEQDSACSFRADLFAALRLIRESSSSVSRHAELDELHAFVRYKLRDEDRRTRRMGPRLFVGQRPLPEFLREALPLSPAGYNLEIISPYFDGGGAPALRGLVETLEPKQARVFLPRKEDGTARCQKAFFDAASGLANLSWGTLPSGLLGRKSEDGAEVPRFVHAKVYRLWSHGEGRQFILVGSANLTQAAHSHSGAGNLEASFLIEEKAEERLQWWLELPEAPPPRRFLDDAMEDEPDEESRQELVLPLALEFSWVSGVARAFWEASTPPDDIELALNGVFLHRLTTLPALTWTELPSDVASRLREHLLSTSFIHASQEGKTCILLVQEEGMEKKPPLLNSLSVEDILRYWSFFTDEQKAAFLEEKLRAAKAARHGTGSGGKLDATPSLFDRFPGIFHAFHQFELRVTDALNHEREHEAVCRLFGARHDSLGTLVMRLRDDTTGDPLHRYVTFLTARQMMDTLKSKFPGFFANHRERHLEVEALLAPLSELGASLDLGGTPSENAEFLEWFRRAFLHRAGDREVAA
jgi:hypothetical protein